MSKAEDTADEIAKLYQKSSGYLSAELDKIFERYKRKHHLTDAEAYRLLNSLHDKTSLEELKEALRAGEGVEKDILAELESPAYQARLNRLQELQNQLDVTMRNIYRQEKNINTSHYVDLANEAYYRSIFDIQQRTGLGFSFSTIDPAVIDKVINSKWSGANYSTRIWNNTQALAQDLKEELLVNLVTGRTDREVAEIIANKYAQGASNARRLVRTESCSLANQMEMQSYEECGIDKYRYVATLDLRTSPACRKLDGKVFTVSEQQPGKNCPPMHPWCRSTTICVIDEMDMAGMTRRARDPVTGKTNTVPADMTYKQWYDKNVKGNSETELSDKYFKKRIEKASDSDIMEVVETIHKSVGAKAKNYEVLNPVTNEIVSLAEGTRITQPKNHVMAGKGRERQIDCLDWLVEKHGGNPDEWTKEKGFGYVLDEYGEERQVELHWYQNPEAGKVEMKIKPSVGGEWYIDED